jgi:ribosomal protein L11 methyltransferase (prmA)
MKKNGEKTTTPIKDLKIIQRNDFQNFTLDSVLISDFVKINRKTKKILDIGTGCGIISILLAKRSKAKITGIEILETMAEIAKENVKNNGFYEQISIVNEDIKNYKKTFSEAQFDTIVTNPPYFEFKGDFSQINDLEQLACARHNMNLTIEEIIKISAYLLKNMGSFSIVFRSERLIEILELLKKYNLEPKRMKNCYTKWNENAKICMIEAIKDAKSGLLIEMPIFVYDKNGKKSEYIENLYK